jgi:predicted GNAT superfamily acetyltransferase
MVPPNPASDAVHAKFGFAEVGRAASPDGNKAVRYLTRDCGTPG